MSKLKLTITMSLDGYVAGPGQSRETPLGVGGEELHEWLIPLKAFRESHGEEGGEVKRKYTLCRGDPRRSRRDDHGQEHVQHRPPGRGLTTEVMVGRRSPSTTPCSSSRTIPRAPVQMEGGTTFHFVTEGIESALSRPEPSPATAGHREGRRRRRRRPAVSGGGSARRDGDLDRPEWVALGGGAKLFDNLWQISPHLEQVEAVAALGVTHIRYLRVT